MMWCVRPVGTCHVQDVGKKVDMDLKMQKISDSEWEKGLLSGMQ